MAHVAQSYVLSPDCISQSRIGPSPTLAPTRCTICSSSPSIFLRSSANLLTLAPTTGPAAPVPGPQWVTRSAVLQTLDPPSSLKCRLSRVNDRALSAPGHPNLASSVSTTTQHRDLGELVPRQCRVTAGQAIPPLASFGTRHPEMPQCHGKQPPGVFGHFALCLRPDPITVTFPCRRVPAEMERCGDGVRSLGFMTGWSQYIHRRRPTRAHPLHLHQQAA